MHRLKLPLEFSPSPAESEEGELNLKKGNNNIKYDKNKTYVANLTIHYKRMLSIRSLNSYEQALYVVMIRDKEYLQWQA